MKKLLISFVSNLFNPTGIIVQDETITAHIHSWLGEITRFGGITTLEKLIRQVLEKHNLSIIGATFCNARLCDNGDFSFQCTTAGGKTFVVILNLGSDQYISFIGESFISNEIYWLDRKSGKLNTSLADVPNQAPTTVTEIILTPELQKYLKNIFCTLFLKKKLRKFFDDLGYKGKVKLFDFCKHSQQFKIQVGDKIETISIMAPLENYYLFDFCISDILGSTATYRYRIDGRITVNKINIVENYNYVNVILTSSNGVLFRLYLNTIYLCNIEIKGKPLAAKVIKEIANYLSKLNFPINNENIYEIIGYFNEIFPQHTIDIELSYEHCPINGISLNHKNVTIQYF